MVNLSEYLKDILLDYDVDVTYDGHCYNIVIKIEYDGERSPFVELKSSVIKYSVAVKLKIFRVDPSLYQISINAIPIRGNNEFIITDIYEGYLH